jgi:hypothetical protein
MTETVFTISTQANCSALELLHEDIDIFILMINFHFEKLSHEHSETSESEQTTPTGAKDDFWNF